MTLKMVSFHNHTSYSFQDAILNPDAYPQLAKMLNVESVGVSEHANLCSWLDFQAACKKKGIKPICGVEQYFYWSNDSKNAKSHHLLTVAMNETGYRNLLKLHALANTPLDKGGGFYYRPRVSEKMLYQHKEGLLIGSACLSSPITSLLIKGDETSARIVIDEFKREFGENFFLEVFPHSGLKIQVDMNLKLMQIAKEMDVPVIVSLDSHFKDVSFEDVYLLNGRNRRRITKSDVENPETDCLRQADFYFKDCECIADALEGHGLKRSDILKAFDHSVYLDSKINFDYKDYFSLPKFAEDSKKYLAQLLSDNLVKRFGGREKIPAVYRDRLRYEYEIVVNRNFEDYFLILWDALNWCREQGHIIGAGRGSAGGCLLAYILDIHKIDPILYSLPFSRFLNEYREGMPDIDTDLSSHARTELIEYLKKRWGENRVVQIITFGEVKAKAAIKDTAKYLEVPFKDVNAITSLIPSLDYDEDGALTDVPLSDALQIPQVKHFQEKLPELFDLALKLEGSLKSFGVHAGGCVILPDDAENIIPIMQKKGGEDGPDVPIVCWDKKQIEKIGLVKYDFLGLSTLIVLNECEKLTGVKIDDIPLDDKKTWKFLQDANHMKAVFQLSEPKTRKYLRDSKPDSIIQLANINTGIRPGADWDTYLKNKKANAIKPKVDLPETREVLKDTYGAVLYQDDLLFLINRLSNFNLGKADLLRRAFEKKDVKKIEEYKKDFIETCIYKDRAHEIFDWLYSSAGYAFNRAHCIAYSLNGFWTAYYKANFPHEFMVANIRHPKSNNKQTKFEYIADFIKEARDMGIKVELPNINAHSSKTFVKDKVIYYGLSGIKGLSEDSAAVIEQIQAKTFEEFVAEGSEFKNTVVVNGKEQKRGALNKSHYKALVKIGFFGNVQEHLKKYNEIFKEEENVEIDFESAVNEGVGFEWYNELDAHLNALPSQYHDTNTFMVVKVESEKTGNKNGRQWRLIKGKSNAGEWSSFNNELEKGGIYLIRYTKRGDSINITKSKRLN